jgi:hypothetical protein
MEGAGEKEGRDYGTLVFSFHILATKVGSTAVLYTLCYNFSPQSQKQQE